MGNLIEGPYVCSWPDSRRLDSRRPAETRVSELSPKERLWRLHAPSFPCYIRAHKSPVVDAQIIFMWRIKYSTIQSLAFTAALISVASLAHSANAEQLPLWEFGLGVGVIAFGDYRGSDASHVYPVPVPYLIYRGTFLKSDQNGVRGQFFNQPHVDFNVSINATPVSGRDAARSGMPNLKPSVEIGPSLNLHLWASPDRRVRWTLHAAARDAFTVESSPHSIGWFAAPTLDLDVAAPFGREGWNLGLLTGP